LTSPLKGNETQAIPEMISNETAAKQLISPKAVFVCLSFGAGHLIKHTALQVLASAARGERWDS
jgi:hypothetical protein